jgi:hypothetical protein
MFGAMPAYGFFIRHVKGIRLSDVQVRCLKEDLRPALLLDDVKGADFRSIEADRAPGAPVFVLKQVENFRVSGSPPVSDAQLQRVEQRSF